MQIMRNVLRPVDCQDVEWNCLQLVSTTARSPHDRCNRKNFVHFSLSLFPHSWNGRWICMQSHFSISSFTTIERPATSDRRKREKKKRERNASSDCSKLNWNPGQTLTVHKTHLQFNPAMHLYFRCTVSSFTAIWFICVDLILVEIDEWSVSSIAWPDFRGFALEKMSILMRRTATRHHPIPEFQLDATFKQFCILIVVIVVTVKLTVWKVQYALDIGH